MTLIWLVSVNSPNQEIPMKKLSKHPGSQYYLDLTLGMYIRTGTATDAATIANPCLDKACLQKSEESRTVARCKKKIIIRHSFGFSDDVKRKPFKSEQGKYKILLFVPQNH